MEESINNSFGKIVQKKTFISPYMSSNFSIKKKSKMVDTSSCIHSFDVNLIKGSSLFYIQSKCETHSKNDNIEDKTEKLSRINNINTSSSLNLTNSYIFRSFSPSKKYMNKNRTLPYKSRPVNLKKSSNKIKNYRLNKNDDNDNITKRRINSSSVKSIKEVRMKLSDLLKICNEKESNIDDNDDIKYINDIITNHRNALITKKVLDRHRKKSINKKSTTVINRTMDSNCNIMVETYNSYIPPPIKNITKVENSKKKNP